MPYYYCKLCDGYYSLFATDMVGLEPLELRRKIVLLIPYCLLLRQLIDNPSVLESLGLFVLDRYTSAVSRKGRRARNRFAIPNKMRILQGSRAVALLNEVVALDRVTAVFADSWSHATHSRYSKFC